MRPEALSGEAKQIAVGVLDEHLYLGDCSPADVVRSFPYRPKARNAPRFKREIQRPRVGMLDLQVDPTTKRLLHRRCCVDSDRAAVKRIPVPFRLQIVWASSVNAVSMRRWWRASMPSS